MIGVFDSGLGGLSVLRAIRERLPDHDLLYLADSAYCPYGPRPAAEVRMRAQACANWLVQQGADLIVIACNTATSAAADQLRAELTVPVVGLEPGLKPAIAASRNGRVGVLATSGTLHGERFMNLMRRFASRAQIFTVPSPDLVGYVEAGDLNGPDVRAALTAYLEPLRSQDVDAVVLGCTHFPFLRPLIAELAGPEIEIIDTGAAVAEQVSRIVEVYAIDPDGGTLRCATTGDPEAVGPPLMRVWGEEVPLMRVEI